MRPQGMTTIAELASAYLDLLAAESLEDVVVIGSSIGGWVAAEMTSGDARGSIAAVILIDSVGIEVEGEPIRDFFALSPREVADYSFHDGDRFYVDPASMSDDAQQTRAANMAALRTYAGDPYMHDPGLRARLARVGAPALVIWGDGDRIATPGYGRAFAESLGNARFEVVHDAGHLPQLEQPDATFSLLDGFMREIA